MKTVIKPQLLFVFLLMVVSQLSNAQTQLTIQNKSGRTIWLEATWSGGGKTNTGNLDGGATGKINVPAGATNMSIRGQFKPGLDPWKNMNVPVVNGSGTITYTGSMWDTPSGRFTPSGGSSELTSKGDVKLYDIARTGDNAAIKRALLVSTNTINHKGANGNAAIHEAVKKADYEMVTTLIKAGAMTGLTNSKRQSPIDIAVDINNAKMVKVLSDNGININSDYKRIMKAVEKGNLDMVKIFLDKGGNEGSALKESIRLSRTQIFNTILERPNFRLKNEYFDYALNQNQKGLALQMLDRDGINKNKAMATAINRKDKALVEEVLMKGGHSGWALEYGVKIKDENLITSAVAQGAKADVHVEKAARDKDLPLLKILVSNQATPQKAMPIAVNNGDINMVKYLISESVTVDEHIGKAVEQGNAEMVKVMIIDGQASPDAPLKIALDKKKFKIAQILVESGGSDQNLLKVAITENQTELLKSALQRKDELGLDLTPGMQLAVDQNNTEYVKLLLNAQADASPINYIQKASNNGNTEMIQALVGAGASPDPAMPIAISKNNTSLVNFLLDNNADASKEAYMKDAANVGNLDIVKALVNRNANPNPAMPVAVDRNDTKMVLYLMDQNVDANNTNYLTKATSNKNETLVKAFLDRNVNPDPALPIAVDLNHTGIVKQLINANANATSPTIIKKAAATCNADIIQTLLNAGAPAEQGMSAAVNRGKANIVKQFITAGADATSPDYMKSTCEKGNTAVAQVLLNAGADPNHGMKPAFANNNTGLAKSLISAGADVSNPTFMAAAAGYGNPELVQLLLGKGVDPNHGLKWSILKNHTNIVMTLLNAGADGSGKEGLLNATKNNNAKVVDALIKSGADANIVVEPAVKMGSASILRVARLQGADMKNKSFLLAAVKAKRVDIASELLEGGSDPNANVSNVGMSLLHEATKNADQAMMSLLLARGADVNSENSGGYTPLMMVVSKGKTHLSHAKLLIEAGANVNAKNNNGEIVFQQAKSSKMKKLLKDKGASKK